MTGGRFKTFLDSVQANKFNNTYLSKFGRMGADLLHGCEYCTRVTNGLESYKQLRFVDRLVREN